MMGARTIQDESWLSGEDAYMCYATSAAEGDNTIMELKIVQVGYIYTHAHTHIPCYLVS